MISIRRLCATVCCLVFIGMQPHAVMADRYDDGMLAYTSGRYDEALGTWQSLADSGHARAQFNLAYMYEFGIAVTASNEEAIKWYRQSATQGYARAQNFLGWMYEMGKGVEQDRTEALKWLRSAADQGSEDAIADYRLVSKRQQRTQEVSYKQELLNTLSEEIVKAQQRYDNQKITQPHSPQELEASNHTI